MFDFSQGTKDNINSNRTIVAPAATILLRETFSVESDAAAMIPIAR